MNPEGRLLHNRYRVLAQIGSGGQASVWLAEDLLLERRVALKELVPHAESISAEESRTRALIEARALARVRHRCIVRVHDIFFVDTDPWIVMEYIPGRSLADIVAEGRPTEREIGAIGLSVVHGLQAVHNARIVHRDVKPLNILVDQDGAIFLVDFGIAKIAEDITSADGSITGRGRVIGTPEYLAPEQFHGHPATPASDLWSLGVTLYYAMEGHTPFTRASAQPAQDLRSAILYENPPPPASQGPLATLVLRMLAKDPARRPNAGEVARLLESILAGQRENGRQSGAGSGSERPVPARGNTLTFTHAFSHTEAMRPLEHAERARHVIAYAVRDVNLSGTDSGVARLLAKPDEEAAHILASCSPEVAAELITGMAASRVSKAGDILQMLSVTRSGKVLDYMPSAASAAVVAALPERQQQVRVLSQADIRTVAEVLMELLELPGEIAERLVAALPARRAGAALNEIKPILAAKILQAQSADTRLRLLEALSPEFRAIVQRFL
ncbi:MAG TPA: protein kinase [Streptosporangiaceae bacterium]|nr:protein kinase [Streptosporangiaceae bacterium]